MSSVNIAVIVTAIFLSLDIYNEAEPAPTAAPSSYGDSSLTTILTGPHISGTVPNITGLSLECINFVLQT
jgi:hypothetical protein